MWSSVRIFSFYENLFESFLYVIICDNLFFEDFMNISKSMTASIWNKSFLIKNRYWYFVDFVCSDFIFLTSIFLLNSVSLNSLNSVAIFTPFAILDSLPSICFMEYIFDCNPTDSSIIFPSDSSFILPIKVKTSLIKRLWIFRIVTKVKQMFSLKEFYKRLLILFHK